MDPTSTAADIPTLGRALRALRAVHGWGQRQTAVRMRRSHAMLSRWEADRLEPSPWDLYRVARLLGSSPGHLLRTTRLVAPSRRCSSRAHPHRRRAALGREIGRRRVRATLSLADAVRVSRIAGRRILAIERGADPSLTELSRLAIAFGFSIDGLFRAAVLDTEPAPTTVPCPAPARPPVRVVRIRANVDETCDRRPAPQAGTSTIE